MKYRRDESTGNSVPLKCGLMQIGEAWAELCALLIRNAKSCLPKGARYELRGVGRRGTRGAKLAWFRHPDFDHEKSWPTFTAAPSRKTFDRTGAFHRLGRQVT